MPALGVAVGVPVAVVVVGLVVLGSLVLCRQRRRRKAPASPAAPVPSVAPRSLPSQGDVQTLIKKTVATVVRHDDRDFLVSKEIKQPVARRGTQAAPEVSVAAAALYLDMGIAANAPAPPVWDPSVANFEDDERANTFTGAGAMLPSPSGKLGGLKWSASAGAAGSLSSLPASSTSSIAPEGVGYLQVIPDDPSPSLHSGNTPGTRVAGSKAKGAVSASSTASLLPGKDHHRLSQLSAESNVTVARVSGASDMSFDAAADVFVLPSDLAAVDITRGDAEALLKQHGLEQGSYIVRSGRGGTVVSMVFKGKVNHFSIETSQSVGLAEIQKFVRHYSVKTDNYLPCLLGRYVTQAAIENYAPGLYVEPNRTVKPADPL